MRSFISYSLVIFFTLAIHSKSIDYVLKYLQGNDLCGDTNLCSEEQSEEEKKSEEEKRIRRPYGQTFC